MTSVQFRPVQTSLDNQNSKNIAHMRELWSKMWWHAPVIPALGRLKLENQEFEANMGNIRSYRLVGAM